MRDSLKKKTCIYGHFYFMITDHRGKFWHHGGIGAGSQRDRHQRQQVQQVLNAPSDWLQFTYKFQHLWFDLYFCLTKWFNLFNLSRQEFVNAYVDYIFNTSVAPQFSAFYAGFHKVCGGKVLELFQPSELQAMIIGNTNYDWKELEKVKINCGWIVPADSVICSDCSWFCAVNRQCVFGNVCWCCKYSLWLYWFSEHRV